MTALDAYVKIRERYEDAARELRWRIEGARLASVIGEGWATEEQELVTYLDLLRSLTEGTLTYDGAVTLHDLSRERTGLPLAYEVAVYLGAMVGTP